jgi:rfaE bifunctional protein kinase chain/domain
MEQREDTRRILAAFAGRRMVVLGDVILDRYWWGEASRLSPEAPVPVVRKRRASSRPGGAANTAANLAALGASVELVGAIGDDREGDELRAVLSEFGVGTGGLTTWRGRPTTTKTRVVAMHQQIVRVDDEETAPAPPEVEEALGRAVADMVGAADAVVVSDYAKGLLSPALLAAAMGAAREAGARVLVDPKGADYARYLGAYLVKPNRIELGLLTGMTVHDHAETEAAGLRLAGRMPGTLVLVTEGADGMSLFGGGETVRVRPAARQVFDVTGAGDTVLATMAMAVAAGAAPAAAMRLASEAAGIAIATLGTAAVTLEQLREAVEPA